MYKRKTANLIMVVSVLLFLGIVAANAAMFHPGEQLATWHLTGTWEKQPSVGVTGWNNYAGEITFYTKDTVWIGEFTITGDRGYYKGEADGDTAGTDLDSVSYKLYLLYSYDNWVTTYRIDTLAYMDLTTLLTINDSILNLPIGAKCKGYLVWRHADTGWIRLDFHVPKGLIVE